ncbi:MAG: ATP-binding cassette domain-containing protein [Nitrososphaeria archaeon]|nr:ATP-binding cassette domain-containing protein [Nitrososphaeria archaeon]
MGKLEVLNGVHLTVHQGEKVGIIGESGCGKTTTMRAILRILATNAVTEGGEIYFRGSDVLKMKKKKLTEMRRKQITMIFQDPTAALNPVFKVGTLLADVIKYSGMNGSEKVTKDKLSAKSLEMLKEVALPDPERVLDSYPFQLSGGMRQRICIAMSLATASDLLIADEPTTNLDVTIQDQVLRLMKNLVEKRSLSVIFVSHALGAIRGTVDRVYVMYAGNMVEVGETKELFSNPLHPYTQGLLESVPKLTGSEFSEGIKGRIPDYINPPTGCRFHPRCDYAMDVCRKEKPQFINVKDDQDVACWYYHKR